MKTHRGQAARVQKNFRARSVRRTAAPAQGRSARVRLYRLWTRAVRWPQSGQQAVGAAAANVTATQRGVVVTSTSCRPGTGGNSAVAADWKL